ncbi:hypothetical protein FQA39_LY11633 [Lamprigera yunnana]|nr:hypothetical protein FQA39_LY11633 [Lamprigera yunnana]
MDTSSSDSKVEVSKRQFESDSDIDLSIDSDQSDKELSKLIDDDILCVGDYILVQFPSKKTICDFVGRILEIDVLEYVVVFNRKRGDKGFSFPDVEDLSTIFRQDVVSRLPKSLELNMYNHINKRTVKDYEFSKDLS